MDDAQPKFINGSVLVVDDDVSARYTMEALLSLEGYEVRCAPNGEVALMFVHEDPPELILLDIRLPDLDGFQVCQCIKEDQKTRDIPIIFISALDEVVNKVKGFGAGAVDYITKPFQASEVLARVETHLGLRRLQRQVEIQNVQLRQEITERKQAQEALQRAHDELEERVKERTADLATANERLVASEKALKERLRMNEIKEKIVDQIFTTLGMNEGVKMKDLFNSVIPALVDIMKIQRCSIFSVMKGRQHAVLEAGYPETEHGIGKVFTVKEPYIDAIVNQAHAFGEFENEKISPAYILINHPEESHLLPTDLKDFLNGQQIHSVLYVPLKVNEVVNYFLVFDAQAEHRQFTDEQIEIFTFFGKELMKGLRLEKMDDLLHDFKNPAIAVAGFAKRIQKIFRGGDYPRNEKVDQALDILLRETSRIQELALILGEKKKESIIDLTEVSKRRFLINQETLKEMKRGNIRLIERNLESPLWVRCFPLHIERVMDNLLSNASNAIPEEGGEISIRSYRKDTWGVVEINNTGQILEEEKDRFILGEGRGRGLHISTRLIKNMKGVISVESGEGQTTFCVMLPLVEPEEVENR